MEAVDQSLRLLTHVLVSNAELSIGHADIVEPAGPNDQITHETDVPMSRGYPAGTLVDDQLAERLADAGFGEPIVQLGHPVVPVALDGDDENVPY